MPFYNVTDIYCRYEQCVFLHCIQKQYHTLLVHNIVFPFIYYLSIICLFFSSIIVASLLLNFTTTTTTTTTATLPTEMKSHCRFGTKNTSFNTMLHSAVRIVALPCALILLWPARVISSACASNF